MNPITASMAAFLVSSTLLLALRPVASSIGLIDRPGGRKTHHGDVPVVGGLAMFGGLIIAAIGGSDVGQHGTMLLSVAAFMVFLGALDDRFNLPARVRLFAHISAAIALVYGTNLSIESLGDFLGFGEIRLGALSIPFTVLSVVALINAFNMLDGLDGLAGGVGLVAFGAVYLLSRGEDAGTLHLIAGSMLGAIVAFSMFNMPLHYNRALRTFMGDAGSTLLGFLLAGCALALSQGDGRVSVPPVVLLWMMPIPIFELITSTIRRIVRGIPPTQADAGHFHHILIAGGFSVRAVCLLYVATSLASAFVAGYGAIGEIGEPALFFGFIAAYLFWLLFVSRAPLISQRLPSWLRRGEQVPH